MSKYLKEKLDAYNDIKAAGKVAIFTREIDGINDPINNVFIEGTTLDINGVVFFIEFSQYEKQQLDIKKVNKKIMFANKAGDPDIQIGDMLDGFRVSKADPFNPDGDLSIFIYAWLEK